MPDFTIEQLEALEEGADSAPWRPEYDEGEDHWVIAFDHPKYGGRWDKGIAHGEETAKLFAAAPDLVDALIAEKQAHAKLREEVEAMREDWGRKAERSASARDNSEHPAKAAHARHLKAHQNAIRRLTRILEADNE